VAFSRLFQGYRGLADKIGSALASLSFFNVGPN